MSKGYGYHYNFKIKQSDLTIKIYGDKTYLYLDKDNKAIKSDSNPVIFAYENGDFKLAQDLKKRFAFNDDISDTSLLKAIANVAKMGKIKMLKKMLKKAKIEKIESDLFDSAYSNKKLKVAKFLSKWNKESNDKYIIRSYLYSAKTKDLDYFKTVHNNIKWEINKEVGDDKDTLYTIVAENGSVEILKYLESLGADVSHKNVNNDNALMLASRRNNFETAIHLAQKKIDYYSHITRSNLYAAYIYSCVYGHIEFMKKLEKKFPDTNFNNYINNRLHIYHIGIQSGNLKVIEYLENRYPCIAGYAHDIYSIYSAGALYGNLKMLKYLIKKYSASFMTGWALILISAFKNKNKIDSEKIVDYLLRKYPNRYKGETLTRVYADMFISDKIDILKKIEKCPTFDISAKFIHSSFIWKHGFLIFAAMNNKVGELERIIKKYKEKLDFNEQDRYGKSVYLNFAYHGHLNLMKLMEETYPTLNVKHIDQDGSDAYVNCITGGYDNAEILKHLETKHNWNRDTVNNMGLVPINLCFKPSSIFTYLNKCDIEKRTFIKQTKKTIKNNHNVDRCAVCFFDFEEDDECVICSNDHIIHKECHQHYMAMNDVRYNELEPIKCSYCRDPIENEFVIFKKIK